MERVICAADVGSTKSGAFAWVRTKALDPLSLEGGADIEQLAMYIIRDLHKGRHVALGLEAPLYIPVPKSADGLSRGRQNEASRSWSAPAGSTVATLALHQAAWLLRRVREEVQDGVDLTISWESWMAARERPSLFVWEAFVSGGSHTQAKDGHLEDAATAVMGFYAGGLPVKPEHALEDAVTGFDEVDVPVLSILGAAAAWAGWPQGMVLLNQRVLVVKPTERGLIEVAPAAPISSVERE